ncbi:YbjN domain-containing protein [Terrarubrum flagellatum]|uniref:YbjN domain-containing protein n=1 Tax=Terrirubrum flagellatum TaxID=2895980 RepID=UPI00314567F0
MPMKYLLAFAMLFIAPLTEVRAQQITSMDPTSILTYLKVKKAAAQIEKDSDGNPAIFAKSDDQVFVVLFYGCKEAKACRAIQFRTNEKPAKPISAERINAWNAIKKFNKAYLTDKGEPYVVMEVVLGEKGLDIADFDTVFSLWKLSMKEFADFAKS